MRPSGGSRAGCSLPPRSTIAGRRVAFAAGGEGRYAWVASKRRQFCGWREGRRHAREALARLGEVATPLVEAALNDRGQKPQLRYELPRVLRQIGTQKAFEAL